MHKTTRLLEFLSAGSLVPAHRPWPRFRLDGRTWRAFEDHLHTAEWTLLAEWGEPDEVHAAFRDEAAGAIAVVSHPCTNRRFVALGRSRPGAIRLERNIRDLYGLSPQGLEDVRPWLDHGRWSLRHPLSATPEPHDGTAFPYAFLTAEGENLHQIPVGPVHAGVIEPGHFRFHAHGETVVRLEERLGYVHRGLEGTLIGKPLELAGRIVGRTSGDSTVAYSLAFARGVEAALQHEIPPRAHWVRGLMAELERIANHLFDIGAICNDAAFALMLSHLGVVRERVLQWNATHFGHRLLMDRVIPGGVALDLTPQAIEDLRQLLPYLRKEFLLALRLYNNSPSLLDRTTGTGIIAPVLIQRFGAGGVVGRAAGRAHDARKHPGYPPYDTLAFETPLLAEGDVHARIELRAMEIKESLDLVEKILDTLPEGAIFASLPLPSGETEGVGLVEGFRGEILVWVRLREDLTIERCHPHDPSWFQWPLLEVAIDGNIVADFPLCNKSFNCSYAGVDL